jgi:hypothetical protein
LSNLVTGQQKAEETTHTEDQKKQAQQAAQQFAQKKPQWLNDWKKNLIADLNRAHFSGAIKDVTGLDYTGIDGATAQKIVAKNPYGTVQLDWTKFAPRTLLSISTSFIKPNAADAADRQWLCAVYASETGQAEEARKLAENAAKAKPEYREQIPALVK